MTARGPEGAAGLLGALLLSVVRAADEALVSRALRWARDLARLGVVGNLPVVHDLGLILAVPDDRFVLGARRALSPWLESDQELASAHARYLEALSGLAEDETILRIRALRVADDVVVALLARLLGRPADQAEGIAPLDGVETIAPLDAVDLERRLPDLFSSSRTSAERKDDAQALSAFADDAPRIAVVLDTLDVETLELLGTYAGDPSQKGAAASGFGQIDLLAALGSVQATDVVRFSLELLPSVLETTRKPSPSSTTAGGYQGLTRRGPLDSLVLTELAWPDDELLRRIVDDEVLYHARERADEPAPRLHLVLVDASASMRGDRTTFARGVAIALAKRLELEGEEARIRFFDGRLHEPVARGGGPPRARGRDALACLPHVLAFRGERGRSPERVLRQLATEIELLRTRERRTPVVHLITHGAFYAPRAVVAEVAAEATIHAILIVPREAAASPIDLDWLDLVAGHRVVDQGVISRREARIESGRAIVMGEGTEGR
jgi:hypothetical protein